MKVFTDYSARQVRLTNERLEHILLHPEMKDMIDKIEETIVDPDFVIKSKSDESVNLYNKYYLTRYYGYKYLCVVVKENENDCFIVTSFIINKLPKGDMLWQKS